MVPSLVPSPSVRVVSVSTPSTNITFVAGYVDIQQTPNSTPGYQTKPYPKTNSTEWKQTYHPLIPLTK